jgi:proteasome lid subunit RPN8/RPN11
MIAHARRLAPMEAVGMLGGNSSGEVKEVIALRNVAGRDLFLADPYDQYQAEQMIQQAGSEVLGVYHSHPGGGAVLSPLDMQFAAKLDLVHVVLAVDPRRSGADVAGYRMRHGRPVQVSVVITD